MEARLIKVMIILCNAAASQAASAAYFKSEAEKVSWIADTIWLMDKR